METPNADSLGGWFEKSGLTSSDIVRAFRTFNAYAPAFKEASDRYAEKKPNRND
jgi:hypothetical protein